MKEEPSTMTPTPSKTDRFDELEELLRAATPLPWSVGEARVHRALVHGGGEEGPFPQVWPALGAPIITMDNRPGVPLDRKQADAALIVAAVNALPALLAERKRPLDVERLARALDAVKMLDSLEGPDIYEFAEAVAAEYNGSAGSATPEEEQER